MIISGTFFRKPTLRLSELESCTRIISSAFFFSLQGYAQEPGEEITVGSPAMNNHKIDSDSPYISWAPGEIYDACQVTLNYSRNDLEVLGDKRLPIVIKRTFSQFQGTGKTVADPKTGVRTQKYKKGVFEIGVTKDRVVNHRFFRPYSW